jgi:hypothetical protein
MAQAMLDAHSAIRARVGVPPLVWSDQLSQVAQDWANHLIATGELNHRPNNRYGENIYAISGGHATPTEAVDLWAKEARGYDIRSNTCSGVCGHYTQNRLGQDPHRWLRCRHRSTAGGLGLQLRSPTKRHRVQTVLSAPR